MIYIYCVDMLLYREHFSWDIFFFNFVCYVIIELYLWYSTTVYFYFVLRYSIIYLMFTWKNETALFSLYLFHCFISFIFFWFDCICSFNLWTKKFPQIYICFSIHDIQRRKNPHVIYRDLVSSVAGNQELDLRNYVF